MAGRRGLYRAEREGEYLHAHAEELDLELSVDDRLWLSHELTEAWLTNHARTVLIDISTVRGADRLHVDQDAKPYGLALFCRPKDEMKIGA